MIKGENEIVTIIFVVGTAKEWGTEKNEARKPFCVVPKNIETE